MATRSAFYVVVSVLVLVALVDAPAGLCAQSPVLDTRKSSTSMNVNPEAFQNLPGARDPWSILSTTPGVLPTGDQGRPSAGTTGDALYTVDGIRIGAPATGGAEYPDLSAIEEVQVQSGGATAMYGSDVGGVIQVVTKSGRSTWEGSGRFVLDGDASSGLGGVQDPSFQIEIAQDAAGGYCLNGFQVMSAGQPIANGDGPIHFGFDHPFTIGVTSGPGTSYGAGDGSLNLSQLPGCAGQSFGLTFIDTPAPFTPPDPTHLFLGQNGSYLVDMGRIGASYGIPDQARANANALEDTHIFSSSFYLTGMYQYASGGFQLAPQAGGVGGGVGENGGAPSGVFLYGVDPEGIGDDWTPRVGLQYSQHSWDFNAIRVGDPPVQMPDINGDGKPDSVFLPLAMLEPAGQGAIGGGFRAGGIGTGGGTLVADPSWVNAAGAAGVRGMLENYFSTHEIGEFTIRPKPGQATTGDAGLPNDIGGPIIKDRLWIFGSYGQTATEEEGDDAPLFSESFYESRPNYAQLFQPGFYTQASVQRAPAGLGVQGIGLEVDGQPYVEERSQLGGDRYAPGGAALGGAALGGNDSSRNSGLWSLADALDAPILYVVAEGGPTGDVFRVEVVQPETGPVEIHGLVAVEPVAATAEDRARFERELAELPGERYARRAAGYCLQMDALAPPAGMVYRVAPPEKQAAFAPMRRALEAARRLRDAGQLHPDSDPTDYYHAIRQWAVWSIEKGYDREGFLTGFVERMEQNFREAGQAWSDEVAAAVRSYGEGRWTDIRAILDAAEAAP